MNPFTYARAADEAGALAGIAAHPGAAFIGGGTNLLDLMKEGVARPRHLVDINPLPMKSADELPDGGLRLGAGMTNAQTAYHPAVAGRYPLVARAILAGASPQLRNMATNGGNLLQRTRCYYFYDVGTPCNKRDPGSGCGALHGVNRIHAILGQSAQCIAVHPSDFCVALAALEAVVRVKSAAGERAIPFNEFHRLPGDRPELDTTLRPGELITAIDLPPRGFQDHYTYLKVRDRASYAFALVSVAVGLEMDGPTITAARLALGGVAHKPWRDEAAEGMLVGRRAAAAAFGPVADFIVRDAHGYDHNRFKIELARRAIVRALEEAAGLEKKP
jgi:xanthine dehydrogenase YagS FAD-binding subunit